MPTGRCPSDGRTGRGCRNPIRSTRSNRRWAPCSRATSAGSIGHEKADRDTGPDPDCAPDLKRPFVALDDMLDDREPEPGAAGFAAARRVDAVETLGQTRQMLARDAGAEVGDGDDDPAAVLFGRDRDPRSGPVAAVAQGIADEVVEQLDKQGLVDNLI